MKRQLILLNLVIICVLLVSSSGCSAKTAVPQATPTPTPLPQPTLTPTPRLPADLINLLADQSPLPPQVLSVTSMVSPKGPFQVTFDRPMDKPSTEAAWSVVGADGKPVTGSLSWADQRTLLFTPSQPLKNGAVYLASFSTAAKSADGTLFSAPVDLKFDVTGALHVSQVFPAPDTTGVDNKAVITVLFNRPVVPLVAAEDQGSLPNPLSLDPEVAGKGEWVNTSVFTFHPDKPLQNGVIYKAVVKAGLSAAGGEEGSALAADYAWQFVTVAPSVESFQAGKLYAPQNGQTDVPLDTDFTITFRQAMDQASVEAALTFTNGDGKSVPLNTKWNNDSTAIIAKPQASLDYGTNYILSLDTSAQAISGGGLDLPFFWGFTSVLSPDIFYTDPVNGATNANSRTFMIKFASPMAIKNMGDLVVFNPPLKPVNYMPSGQNWMYNDYDNSLYFYGLQASTHYQVTIKPGMADIYGTAIQSERTVSFTTGADNPWVYLLMPWQTLYRVGGPQEFYIQSVNVSSVNFKLYQLTQNEIVSYLGKYGDPVAKNLVWTHTEASGGKLNEQVVKKITLGDGLKKPPAPSSGGLAPGVYLLKMDSPSISTQSGYLDARLLVVASASITLKTSQGDAMAWLTDLTSGAPLAGVPVTFYGQEFNPVGKGVTDANGLLHQATTVENGVYYAMSDDPQQFAFTSLSWGSGVAPDQFGISSTYYAVNAPVEAYLYTDRPVYRPNQPVYFKGIVRQNDDLAYTLLNQTTVDVTIESYKDQVFQETLPLSPYGTFDGKFTLDQAAALGPYTITARAAGSPQVAGTVSFEVAEYRRPEFMVNVTATPANLLAGDKFTASVSADYYSGGAVAGAQVDWTLQAAPFTFVPPDKLSGYSFTDLAADTGDFYMFPQQPDSVVIAQGSDSKTDAQGKLTLELPAQLSKSGSSQTLTFEATLTDFSGNMVSSRASVVAHQSSVYVGVKPGDYVGTAGKATNFDLVAVDWGGAAQPGQKVNVDIVERQWYSVQQQDQQGTLSWVSSVKEIPVTSFTDQAAGADGKFSVTFTPPHGGVYAARATALDARGNKAVASAYIWVVGSEFIPWRQTNDRSFQLVADQTSYKPGDTAQLLIASPFQGDAYALVTVERGHTRKAEVVHLTSNSTLYKLPITADMAPNVYIAVTVVKGVDDTNPRPDFKIGMTKIKVATDAQELLVTVTPDKNQVGPGEKVSYQVNVTDRQGKPVQAELSMSLSDLATLTLVGPNSSPILDYFYSPRSLGVTTAVSIVSSAEDYNAALSPTMPEGRGGGSGGGKGGGLLGVMDVRQNFPDTAYWEAHLITGADGKAAVTVTLPDNLTIWRMDARAVTQDTRVGQTTVDIASTKPLLVSPQTPRFFVAGDTATLGAAVHNNTDQDMAVSVAIEAEGITVAGDAVQQVQIAAHQQAFVTWVGSVKPDAQRVDLVFSATAGALQDASRPMTGTLSDQGLPVYRYEAKETVATSGQLNAGGARSEAISLPANMKVTQGSLTLQLSPSLAASMTDGLTYLQSYPYECTEQTISRFLPNVLTTRALQAAGLSNPDLEAKLKDQVNQAMQRLANNQNADGGWGWWSGQNSDVLTSAYVVQGLVEAKDAGYTVSEDVTRRGVEYLNNNLKVLETLAPPQVLNLQAYVLYVLARSGNPNPSFTVQLYNARQSLSLYGHAYLAQALYMIDQKDARLATLLSDLNNAAIMSATGSHWEEKYQDYWNWNTDVRSTAIILDTLILLNPTSDLNANAVRWLMSSRTGGFWHSTQETAWVLIALTDWIKTTGELNANYQYAAALNGSGWGDGMANADTLRQTQTLQMDVSSLIAGQPNRLVVARSDGPGTLYYTAQLNLYLPVEQVKSLDRGFSVSRQYFNTADLNTPITTAKPGDLVLARLTVVVPDERHYVVIEDPLPAGLEVIDTSLNTSPQALQPQEYDYNKMSTQGYGWWYFSHVELRDEKVVLSADYLPAGTYVYTYYARAVTPGSFQTIPPVAQEFYFPEVYGRGDGSLFEIKNP